MYRAVLKYPGSKWRIADKIISYMPTHRSYLEPYFGSGAVFYRKQPSKIETINDINGDVVNLFSCIREYPEALSRMIAFTPYSREEYERAFKALPDNPCEQARLFLIKSWQSFGFRVGQNTGWKNDVAGREYAYAVKNWCSLPEWIMQATFRLKHVQIEQRPAIELIRRFNSTDVLIYADPPYLLSTRKTQRQYSSEMADNDHLEMLKALVQHQGPVILSGYENPLYNDALRGWHKEVIPTTAQQGLQRLEVLWMNFDCQLTLY